MKTPQFTCEMKAPKKAKLEIYGDIGPGWLGMIDAKLVADALTAAGDLDEVEVRINSLGGDAFQGLGIANILKDHPASVNVVVDGIAASAASLIAMAGNSVRIPKNAMLMIHDPWTIVAGGEADLEARLQMLKVTKKVGVELYASKSKKTKEDIAALMKAETWYTGEEAVAAGFADSTEQAFPKDKAPTKEGAKQAYHQAIEAWNYAMPAVLLQLQKESVMAEQTKTLEVPAPAPVPAATTAPAAVSLTAAEAKLLADASAKSAVEAERARTVEIHSLCSQACKPEMGNDFVEKGSTVDEVRKAMFEVMCRDRKPADDPGVDMNAKPDPDAKFKAEYAADRAVMQKAGITEEHYVASRRVTETNMGDVSTFKPAKAA